MSRLASHRRTRLVGAALAVVLAVSLAAPPAAATPSAPPTPTPTNAIDAQAAAHQAAKHVVEVRDRITTATKQLAAADRAASLAQARFSAQLDRQRMARARVQRAVAQVAAARIGFQQDHKAFLRLISSVYESGGTTGIGGLLLAQDPSALLASAQTRQMIADQQAGVVARAQATTDAYRAAEAHKRAALVDERLATAAVGNARDEAALTLRVAHATMRTLQRRLVQARASRAHAEAILSTFLGGWALADPARADALDQQYLELARRHETDRPAPRSSTWTAAMGRTVVTRALLRIGTPYAWAGGNSTGPTTGVCVGGAARHDCQITGFDCSGLSLYSWAPYLAMPHLASTQYTMAGHLHPDAAELRPGDLVFWSSDGSVSGIHHVALYVGDGMVVQAPQSGDIVRVTPLGSVDSGYFGATRPLT